MYFSIRLRIQWLIRNNEKNHYESYLNLLPDIDNQSFLLFDQSITLGLI